MNGGGPGRYTPWPAVSAVYRPLVADDVRRRGRPAADLRPPAVHRQRGERQPVTEPAPESAPLAVELKGITKRFPGRGRQLRHPAEGPPRRGARHRGGERRGQVHLDEDPLRHAPARRGPDPARRPGGRLQEPRRTRSPPAWAWCTSTSCWPTTSRCWRTSCWGREKVARHRRRRPGPGSPRSPTPTPSAWTLTAWSRTSAWATGSGWRSPRCSTGAPPRSSSTNPPPCWSRRRWTSCSATSPSSSARVSRSSSSRTSSTRSARSPMRSP